MAAAFLLVPAVPASAHIDGLRIDVVYGGTVASTGGWLYTRVDGYIGCAEGEKFLITAKVIDDRFVGKGRTKGTCTGDPEQYWSVTLSRFSGFEGDGCWERVAAKAHTKVNGVDHDEETDVGASHLPPNCS